MSLYKPDRVQTIAVRDDIPDLEAWAAAHGTTYQWVKFLNPWILNRRVPVNRGGSYTVAIPAADCNDFLVCIIIVIHDY